MDTVCYTNSCHLPACVAAPFPLWGHRAARGCMSVHAASSHAARHHLLWLPPASANSIAWCGLWFIKGHDPLLMLVQRMGLWCVCGCLRPSSSERPQWLAMATCPAGAPNSAACARQALKAPPVHP